MGLNFERRRLQKPEVEHLGTYSLYWEPEKLSIAKIVCHIWYSPVLLLLFVADLLRLFISTGVGSVCILIYLIPLWWSQLQNLKQQYHKWKDRHSASGRHAIHHSWCLPIFMISRLPSLFCTVVRAMSISWTQIGLLRCEFVSLWACRVQHLRPYYCGVKPKQQGKAVISCYVWYLPLLMLSWLTALSCFIIISLHQQQLLETFSMVSNLLLVLKLHLPMVGMWWYMALVQSEEQSTSRHHNSKLCYGGCSMCSNHELGKGCVNPESVFEGIPATKVCHPLKHKCLGARKVEYILHHEDGPKTVTMLLLLSGDVERNPGPDYDQCVRELPDSARQYLDKVLDWDNKGVDKDLEKMSHLVTDDVKIKLLSELEIPDEDMQKINEDFPNKELLQWQAILRKWKELKGADATYGKLLRLCCENGIQSIAEAICDMLRSRVYGADCDRSLERSKENDVLRKMTSTLNVAISQQSDPLRFADAAYSAGFISEEAKNDAMSSVRNDYGKVSKVVSVVKTHITQQANYDKVCQKFDHFILLLHDELKMKDLARQLVEKLRRVKQEYKSPIQDESPNSGTTGSSASSSSTVKPLLQNYSCQGHNIDSLSETDRDSLKQQLRANLMMIYDAYSDYTDCIAVSLDEKKVNIQRLKAFSMNLYVGCDEHNLIPLSSRAGDEFKQVDNVYDVIAVLCKFTSFLNCHVFEQIISKFKIDKTQDELKYPEKLRQYVEKHTVSELMEIHPVLNEYTDHSKELVILLDVNQITCHMSEVLDVGQALAHIMKLDQCQLLIHNIGGGSVRVTFLIPTLVAERIFNGQKECIFSQDQIEELRKISIAMLKCNGYDFDLISPSGCCGEYDTDYYGTYYCTERTELLKSYEELFHSFSKNISSCEDSYDALFSASNSVFALEDLSSSWNCEELLQYISKQRVCFNDIFLVINIIRSVGSRKDREACDMFERRFDKYVEGLAYEYRQQVCAQVDRGYFLVEFIIDKGHQQYLYREFKHMLVEGFSIPQEYIEVKLSAIGGPIGGQVFLIQLPENYSSSFVLSPLYGNRIHALKNHGVQFVRYKKDEIFLSKWSIYSKQEIVLGETLHKDGHNEVISVNIRGTACMAVQYTEVSGPSAELDEGYIQYLESVLNHHHKNIPAVKGLCYFLSHSKQYPLLIMENCLPLKLYPQFPFGEICQVSLLLDLVNSVIEFKAATKFILLNIYTNAVYLCTKENRLEAKLCPLYGCTFLFDQAKEPKSLSVESFHWISAITEYLQFGKDGEKLPENHVLKLLCQKWLSKDDNARPRDYEELHENLCDLHGHLLDQVRSDDASAVYTSADIHFILIGHANVGKTSLRKHLRNQPIDMEEPPTIVMESEYIREIGGHSNFSVTMWDTGGHPFFQDLLPCFARLMCLYGLVFRIPDIENFDSYPEIRRCEYHEEAKSAFTNREIMFRNLAFIQAFSVGMQINEAKTTLDSLYKPAAVIIGTNKDKSSLSSETLIQGLNSEIARYKMLKVYPASAKDCSYVHEIDNTVSGIKKDQGIIRLRDNLSHYAKLSGMVINRDWTIFKNKLMSCVDTKYYSVGIVPLNEAIAIGKECGIDYPKAALRHFHELGMFMWYYLSKREIMYNLIVVRPKLLLEVLSQIFSIDPALIKEHQMLPFKGILACDFFDFTIKAKTSSFDAKWFVAFLEEQYMGVKFKFGHNLCYFIPSLLDVKVDYNITMKSKLSPLCIVPHSGYVATGIFPRLLAALAGVNYGSTIWTIPLKDNVGVCRNKFIFVVNDNIDVVLREYSNYIQVDCSSGTTACHSDIYFRIAATIEVQLQRIVPQWFRKKEFNLTFKCENESCPSYPIHFLSIESLFSKPAYDVVCSNGLSTSLKSSHLHWYRNLDPKDQSESSSLFQKALNDGWLDIRMATVMFIGLDHSLTLKAKHAVFQDPSGTTLSAALPVNHEIYFNVNDANKLLRRLQNDDFDDIIVSSMSSKEKHEWEEKSDNPKRTISESGVTNPSSQEAGNQSQLTSEAELREQEQYYANPPTSYQEKKFAKSDSIESNDEHEFALKEASNFQNFIQHLNRLKSEGKVQLYHVFDFGSLHQMSEIYKIFIQNVTLCVMVTESSEHFHAEEIGILQNNLSSSSPGLIVENHTQKDEIRTKDAKTNVLHQFSNVLVKNDKRDSNSYLFPMNCLNLDNADRDCILSHAVSSLSSTTFPFSWYLFGFRLMQIMNKKQTASVSNEGTKIASELNMDRPTTEAALEHLMERNIIIYFRDILSDTVFLDVRIFSKIFLALSEKSDKLTGTITRSDFDYAVQSSTKYVSSDDFATLFLKLMIIAPYKSGDGRYLMPSLLVPLNKTTIDKICQEYGRYPVYFTCPSLGYEFITMLTAFLLNLAGDNWQILNGIAGNPVCLHKNCVKFQYGKSTVLVSYLMGVIEVNMRSQDQSGRIFRDVSATISRGLEKIRLILNSYHSFSFNMSFPCHCGKADHKHSATLNSETVCLQCDHNKSVFTNPSSSATRWINVSALGSITVNNIMKFLEHLSSQWSDVARKLEIPDLIVTRIKVSRLRNDRAYLKKVVEWWFQNTPNPNWDTIQEVLPEACAVPETPQPGTGDEKSELDKPRNSNTPVNQFILKGTVNIRTLKKIVQEEIGHDWKQLARSLKFVETDIQAIEHDNVYSLKEQIYQFLYQWERMVGNDATPEVLLKGVVEARLGTILNRLYKDGLIQFTGGEHPVQESAKPVQETTWAEHPRLMGMADKDMEDVEIDRLTNSPRSPEDDARHKIRIKRLCKFEADKIGEGPFDVGHMVRVESLGYGVVKWIGIIFLGTDKLTAGIEFEEPVEGGHNGDFKGVKHFTCDPGVGLYLPYFRLRSDTRFSAVSHAESNDVTLTEVQRASRDQPPAETQSEGASPVNSTTMDSCGRSVEDAAKPLIFSIPSDRAGLVIGKDGKNILEVERATNTIIKVDDHRRSLGDNRYVVITGSTENCKKAFFMITQRLQRKVYLHTATSETIKVPARMVGRLIGKNGVTIETIKSLSGAHDIKFSDRPLGLQGLFQHTEQECTITGSHGQIKEAKKLIQQVLSGEHIDPSVHLAALMEKLGIQFEDEKFGYILS